MLAKCRTYGIGSKKFEAVRNKRFFADNCCAMLSLPVLQANVAIDELAKPESTSCNPTWPSLSWRIVQGLVYPISTSPKNDICSSELQIRLSLSHSSLTVRKFRSPTGNSCDRHLSSPTKSPTTHPLNQRNWHRKRYDTSYHQCSPSHLDGSTSVVCSPFRTISTHP